MSRRATVRPDWLDSMLVAWGLSTLKAQRGWYSVNPMLRAGIPRPTPTPDLWDITSSDYRQLEAHIRSLEQHHQAAVIRAYRPWTARTIEELHPDATAGCWFRWLHGAAERLAAAMDRRTIQPWNQHENA